jgi:hypothetical protein
MTNKCDTSSVRAVMTVIALSALSLTTTLNTGGMTYNDSPLAIMGNMLENDMGTTTPSPQMAEPKGQTNYAIAKELFGDNMRDFTKEETEIYKASLKKIYKKTGVNIFDIC